MINQIGTALDFYLIDKAWWFLSSLFLTSIFSLCGSWERFAGACLTLHLLYLAHVIIQCDLHLSYAAEQLRVGVMRKGPGLSA